MCVESTILRKNWKTKHFWLERWNLVSLCEQHRRCGVVKQFLLTLWARLKLASEHFGGKNREIDKAAIVQAVVIFFLVPRLEWLRKGSYSNWTQINAGGAKCGYYSSYSMGHYGSQAWGPWPDNAPTRRLYVGHLNRCTFHLAKIGMTWREVIIRVESE